MGWIGIFIVHIFTSYTFTFCTIFHLHISPLHILHLHILHLHTFCLNILHCPIIYLHICTAYIFTFCICTSYTCTSAQLTPSHFTPAHITSALSLSLSLSLFLSLSVSLLPHISKPNSFTKWGSCITNCGKFQLREGSVKNPFAGHERSSVKIIAVKLRFCKASDLRTWGKARNAEYRKHSKTAVKLQFWSEGCSSVRAKWKLNAKNWKKVWLWRVGRNLVAGNHSGPACTEWPQLGSISWNLLYILNLTLMAATVTTI